MLLTRSSDRAGPCWLLRAAGSILALLPAACLSSSAAAPHGPDPGLDWSPGPAAPAGDYLMEVACVGGFIGSRVYQGRDFDGSDAVSSYGCSLAMESESGLGFDLRLTTSERYSDQETGLVALESEELSAGVFQSFGELGLRPYLAGGLSLLGVEEYVVEEVGGAEVSDDDLFLGGYAEGGLLLGNRGSGMIGMLAWRHYVGGEVYDQLSFGIGFSF